MGIKLVTCMTLIFMGRCSAIIHANKKQHFAWYRQQQMALAGAWQSPKYFMSWPTYSLLKLLP